MAMAHNGEHQTTRVEFLFSIIFPQLLHFLGRIYLNSLFIPFCWRQQNGLKLTRKTFD
jgi:hypothetical protein